MFVVVYYTNIQIYYTDLHSCMVSGSNLLHLLHAVASNLLHWLHGHLSAFPKAPLKARLTVTKPRFYPELQWQLLQM
jgi:hypothetical protein